MQLSLLLSAAAVLFTPSNVLALPVDSEVQVEKRASPPKLNYIGLISLILLYYQQRLIEMQIPIRRWKMWNHRSQFRALEIASQQ